MRTHYVDTYWSVHHEEAPSTFYCIMPLDEDPGHGVDPVATGLSVACATHIVALHNDWLIKEGHGG